MVPPLSGFACALRQLKARRAGLSTVRLTMRWPNDAGRITQAADDSVCGNTLVPRSGFYIDVKNTLLFHKVGK